MVLKEFDPKLMRFLYFLATHQKKMSSVDVSIEAKKEGWDLSDRTIRRWLKQLNLCREINYFSNLKTDQLGIKLCYVLLSGEHILDICKIIPFNVYNIKALCLNNLKQCFLVQYDVPSNRWTEFKMFWKTAKKCGLADSYKLYPHETSITFYSPFHENVNREGYITFNENYDISNYFMKLYSKLNLKKIKNLMNAIIIKHPILVPILYSSLGENFSTKRIWESLKKHSERIWDFIPKKLLRKGKKDGVAIKYVHDILNLIEMNKDELFQQIRVSYRPFYYGHHNGYYILIKLKNEKNLDRVITELHRRTLQLQYMPPVHGNEYLFYFITNEKMFSEIMHDILPMFIDTRYDNKVILQDLRGIKNTYGKVDWTMFDPAKKEWIYEHDKYMKELKNLAQKIRTK